MATNNPLVCTLPNGYPEITARFRAKRPDGFYMQMRTKTLFPFPLRKHRLKRIRQAIGSGRDLVFG